MATADQGLDLYCLIQIGSELKNCAFHVVKRGFMYMFIRVEGIRLQLDKGRDYSLEKGKSQWQVQEQQ